jgi:hypothetical protein
MASLAAAAIVMGVVGHLVALATMEWPWWARLLCLFPLGAVAMAVGAWAGGGS